jgi:hypothetical protein
MQLPISLNLDCPNGSMFQHVPTNPMTRRHIKLTFLILIPLVVLFFDLIVWKAGNDAKANNPTMSQDVAEVWMAVNFPAMLPATILLFCWCPWPLGLFIGQCLQWWTVAFILWGIVLLIRSRQPR